MKKLAVLPAAIGGLLSGCVAYEVPSSDGRYYSDGRYTSDGRYYGDRYRDRDGDGVPNRLDRRPDDPRRY